MGRHAASTPSRLGLLALLPAALFVWTASRMAAGGVWEFQRPWVPSLGVAFALRLDGLALQFVGLISGVGTAVFVYAAGYMAGHPRRVRLYVLLGLFMTAMLGCVAADDLLLLFVFWELTSLASFLLIGLEHEKQESRAGALQALQITAGGGLFLLAGAILLREMAGTWSIQGLIEAAPTFAADPRLPAALACLLVGAFAKSAQFPFHFWLPGAMAAPTPVSAFLHSATMVKLGVYLLARLDAAFGELPGWQIALAGIGALTSVLAMLLALRERDLKRILAWSTVSALGTLIMLIGLPGERAALAAAAFLLAHALYKAPLFFVAGNLDHATGTRSIDRLAGLARALPWTAAAAGLAALSMAGLPLSFGFVAKDLIGSAKAGLTSFGWVGPAGIVVSAVSVAVAGVAALRIFWHRGGESLPAEIHEVGWPMRLAPLGLGAAGVVLGLAPGLAEALVGRSALSMLPALVAPGLEGALRSGPAWSAAATALGLGGLIFLSWERLHRLLERMRTADRLGPAALFQGAMRAVPWIAGAAARRLQHGRLTGYLALQLGAAAATLSAAFWLAGRPLPPELCAPSLGVAGGGALVLAASVAVVFVRDRFVLLLASGMAGVGCAALFLFLGAPDLAFTQFAVEAAFVVVVASAVLRIRRLALPAAAESGRGLRLALGLAVGALLAGLLLWGGGAPLDPSLSSFFAAKSVPEAHGRNVVNVIIVDFRALDTLGEIAVVALTGLALAPLFRLLRGRGKP